VDVNEIALEELAARALDLQDACNPTAVAGVLRLVFEQLIRFHGESTSSACHHPIPKVIMDKLMDLMAMDGRAETRDWNAVMDMAGRRNNIDRLQDAVEKGA
jgi:hypothetical protein